MSKRIFTKEQVEKLSNNNNIASCSEKSITYGTAFKNRAVMLYEQGMTAREIFKQAELDLAVIGRETPKDCLKRWNKSYRNKGINGLKESRGHAGKGGRPKTRNVTEADKIKRLEAEVAYLKAENDFLAKLRAKRAE